MEIFAESSRLTEISLQPRQQACGVPFSVLPLKMALSPEEEEAFDFFLLLSLAKPTLPSADTTFSEGGGGFSNYQRHRYYPSTDAPPFSLLPSPFPSLEGGVNPSLSLCLSSSRHGFHKAVCTLAEREGGNKRHRNIKRGCAIAIIGAASSLLSVLKTS